MANFKFITDKLYTSAGMLDPVQVNTNLSATINPSYSTTGFDLLQNFSFVDGAFNVDQILATTPDGGSVTYNFPKNGCKLVFSKVVPYQGAIYRNVIGAFYDSNDNEVAGYNAQMFDDNHRSCNVHFGFVTDTTTGEIYLGLFYRRIAGSDSYYDVDIITYPPRAVTPYWNGIPVPDTPYALIPDSSPDGGFGGADYSNDDTDFSGLPTLSSSQVGFCSLYKMTQQQMADLADYLWGLSTGTIATFLPVFSNPMDCIIAVGIVPVDPEVEIQDDLIKVGNLTTTVWARRITKQYDEIDMGEVEIGKGDFTNSFMDYSPYTKIELYLPYIGNVSLDTDEVMDSTIKVKYKFDLLSGSCVAEVKVTKTYNYQDADHVHSNILYRYSGNFLANIPINGENFSQMFNAVIGAVAMGINAAGNYKTGIASADMAKSADVSAARSDAASLHRSAAAFNGVGATSAMKPSIQRAGNVSSVCGFLSKQKPEIILKLPKIANIGENQGHEVGYPRYGEYTIAELEGYSSIMMIHLKNIPCTDTERELIERDLNSGVIFSKTAVPQHSEFQNTVKVYKFKCENICVNKADDWELIDTLTVAWRNPNIDVLNPIIRIEATSNLSKRRILREGNYVYIADFERYYYVKSMKAQAGNFIELELAVDACMSWLTNLRNQQCVVDRQEKVWNTYLNDEFMRVYNTPYTVVKEFPNGFSTQNFVLAVAGGGNSNSGDGGGGGSSF